MNKLNLKEVVYLSLVAAIYVVLTLVFAPISYTAVQFRISEILVLLVLYNKKYILPLTIGTLLSNIGSPIGWDWAIGTLATLISLVAMRVVMKTIKSKLVAAFMPVIINAIIIGAMVAHLEQIPLLLTMLQVGIGQFVVIMVMGLSIFRSLERNEFFAKEVLEIEPVTQQEKYSLVTIYNTLAFVLVTISSILFFQSPMFQSEYPGIEGVNFTLSFFTFEDGMNWVLGALILPMLTIISITFLKGFLGVFVTLALLAGTIANAVLAIHFSYLPLDDLHLLALGMHALVLSTILFLQILQWLNVRKQLN